MNDREVSKADIFTAPTKDQLIQLGSSLTMAVETAIAYYKIMSIGYDGMFDFNVEGAAALMDREGYTRSDALLVGSGAFEADTPDVRSLTVLSSRYRYGDGAFIGDVYRVDFIKNTQVVKEVRKAGITREFLEETDAGTEDISLVDILTDPNRLVSVIQKREEVLQAYIRNIEDQTTILGPCSASEVSELNELIDRSRPTERTASSRSFL